MSVKTEILCIHYYYPPIRSGGVLRNYYFSREFAKFFSKVHVITTSNVDIMDQELMELPENVVIYKAATKDFRSITKQGNHRSESLKNSVAVRFFIKLKKTLPFHFWIGEGGQKYIKSATKIAAKIIENNKISHVYSSFMPYADHKVASKLSGEYHSLKWIADFRDLQVEPIYNNIYFPVWNKSQERSILRRASLITTVSQGLASSMNYLKKPVLSVPRGIELWAKAPIKNEVFTIAYTGNLFQHYRDGAFFVQVFCEFIRENDLQNKVQFVYAGRDSKAWETWFDEEKGESFFKDEGFTSRERAREIQGKAHALLLLSSATKEHQGVLTGKLFEYLETKNPIINCINGVEDLEFEGLFKDLEAGWIFYSGEEAKLKNSLAKLYQNYEQKEAYTLSNEAIENRKKITWEARVKTILDAC